MAYERWDREAATRRALRHADASGACTKDGCVWNFAFGSNVNPSKVASRGMAPSCVLRGVLPGWRLLFNHVGGYGNVEETSVIAGNKIDVTRLSTRRGPPQPDEVHGVLLKLSRDEFARMAWEEYAYNTVEVPVEVYPEDAGDGEGGSGNAVIQKALAFKTHPCALTTGRTLPSSRYLKLIQRGARKSGIREGYCLWLGSIPNA